MGEQTLSILNSLTSRYGMVGIHLNMGINVYNETGRGELQGTHRCTGTLRVPVP